MTLRTSLAITLRWLAGGSYWDISALFGVGHGGFFSERGPVWRTLHALETALQPCLVFDTSEAACALASEGFKKFAKGRIDGCVLAVDGLVTRTRAPHLTELDDAADRKACRNRKGCFGMVAIAGCDSDCKFTFFSCNMSGSTHDALAIHGSAGGRVLLGSTLPSAHRKRDHELPEGYFAIGDEAFPNCNSLLTPWSGRSLSLEKDSFNYHLSSMRQCIERAFGMMMKRWGIFHRRLNFRADKWGLVVVIAAQLHNFCIVHGAGVPPPRHPVDQQPGDACQVMSNEEHNPDPKQKGNQWSRRSEITEELKKAGLHRPKFRSVRVRAS